MNASVMAFSTFSPSSPRKRGSSNPCLSAQAKPGLLDPGSRSLRSLGRDDGLETPRDQQLHDLVRPRVDTQHPRVAVEARDRIFVHIAIAAEQLKAAVDDLGLDVGQAIFGHRSGHRIELAGDVLGDAIIDEAVSYTHLTLP